ncbi:MAG: AraC family transcriptional regulator [Pseudomonadota bacterium]
MGKAKLDQSLQFIEENLGAHLDVGFVAEQAHQSVSKFSRDFSETMGTSVWSYIKERRCLKAVGLLETTDAPASEIALDCGFSSQSHMIYAMRRALNTTPGKVRRCQVP